MTTNYRTELAKFHAMFDEMRAARHAYRAREIGDDEFLTVRAKFEAAKEAFDAVEPDASIYA